MSQYQSDVATSVIFNWRRDISVMLRPLSFVALVILVATSNFKSQLSFLSRFRFSVATSILLVGWFLLVFLLIF